MDKLILSEVHTGAQVIDADGVEVGQILEISGEHFRVREGSGKEFWLTTSIVESADNARVLLRFESAQLPLYEAMSPEADDADTARQTPDGEIATSPGLQT